MSHGFLSARAAAKENSKIASSWDMAVLLACFFLSLCHNVVSRALSL
jgi:hypothetical protein